MHNVTHKVPPKVRTKCTKRPHTLSPLRSSRESVHSVRVQNGATGSSAVARADAHKATLILRIELAGRYIDSSAAVGGMRPALTFPVTPLD